MIKTIIKLKSILIISLFLSLKYSDTQSQGLTCQLSQDCGDGTAISCSGESLCIGVPWREEINCDGYVWNCSGAVDSPKSLA